MTDTLSSPSDAVPVGTVIPPDACLWDGSMFVTTVHAGSVCQPWQEGMFYRVPDAPMRNNSCQNAQEGPS